MIKRDETKPRVSNVISFLYKEELDAIPSHILEAAAQRGTEKHKLIEDNFHKQTDNVIANMFKDGLKKTLNLTSLHNESPTFEEQLNGKRFTGKPDFRLRDVLVDYKFSNDLRPVTALQLVLYGFLIHERYDIHTKRYYAFHFPKDHGLFIYRICDNAIEPLFLLAEYIIKNHEAIKSGDMEKYDALIEWEKIQQDYTLFELVGTVLPPLTVTNEEQAITAAILYCNIKDVLEYEKKLKRELKRYLEEQGISKVEDISGYGIRLQSRKNKVYDPGRKAAAKKIYDASLSECQTDTIETTSIVRITPRKKKPIKQIN